MILRSRFVIHSHADVSFSMKSKTNDAPLFLLLFITDNVSSLLGSTEKHDIPLWSRYLSNVRRSYVRMPDLPKNCGAKNPTLLNQLAY